MVIRSVSPLPTLGFIPKLNQWSETCIHEPPLLDKHTEFFTKPKHPLHRELMARHKNQFFSPHSSHMFPDSTSDFTNDVF